MNVPRDQPPATPPPRAQQAPDAPRKQPKSSVPNGTEENEQVEPRKLEF